MDLGLVKRCLVACLVKEKRKKHIESESTGSSKIGWITTIELGST